MPNCKILIATQSDYAANTLATRLISCKPDIGLNLLRLVNDVILDRQNLPKELHKFSATVSQSNANNIDDDSEDDSDCLEIPSDVKRNCPLSYLKNFKIIIGTCNDFGVLFNR